MPPPPADKSTSSSLVMFSIDQRRFAVPLSAVERVMPAGEIRPLAWCSASLLGFTLLADRPVPVLDLRRHLGLAERPVQSSDRFLLVRSGCRTVALVAEENDCGVAALQRGRKKMENVEGVTRMANGLTLIFDIDRLLDETDQKKLDQMIRRRTSRRAAVAAASATKTAAAGS